MDTSNSLDRRLNLIWFRTATVSLVAGSLVLPGASVLAAPASSASPTEASATDVADPTAARSLFEQGLDAYEAEDYAAAAEYWSEAHELMAETPELSASRQVLGFDLAQVQMRAYDQDHDESRVAAAKPLLESFVAWVDRPEHTMDEGEKQDRARAVELLERIERESSTPTPVPVPAPEVATPAATETPAPPPIVAQPSGTGFLIGGGLALGGGVASGIAAFGMIASGRAAQDRYLSALENNDDAGLEAAERDGRRANFGFAAAATSAVLLSAAGVTMLVIGARRRKQHVSASAALAPGSAAASVSVRF